MTSGKKPGEMQDMLVLGGLDDIRLVMSEKHNRILRLVLKDEQTISDISRALDMNPGSVHYYLKDLEKHGLIRQVREEIKGGVVKKYYRSAARRIVMEPPEFSGRDGQVPLQAQDYQERLIKAIEYLGYHLPPELGEDAKDLLARYDRRMMGLKIELQNAGLDRVEDNGYVLEGAYDLVLAIRGKNDPELNRLYNEFEKLFLRYG